MAIRYIATIEGSEQEVEIDELAAPGVYRVQLGGKQVEADLRRVGGSSFSVIVGTRSFDFDIVREGDQMLIASRAAVTRVILEDAARRAMRSRKGAREVSGRAELRAMMPGRVVNVLVKSGDEVKAGQGVVVVEAMKMENELKSPKAGKVAEVKVVAGQTVEKGELLMVIE